MESNKAVINDIIYHKDLNKLICCRDNYFNLCYDDETFQEHLTSKIKYYTLDNSGGFHTSDYKFNNTWEAFKVISAKFGGGSESQGYPDAWNVICSPLDNPNVLISFNQLTNCFAHRLDTVTSISFSEYIEKKNKKNWICIGEVEELLENKNKSFFECSDSEHNYLFRSKNNNYMYSIAPSYAQVGFVNPIILDIEVSIITFLIMFISMDREYGRINGHGIGNKANAHKIRLAGMKEWLTTNEDFLNNKISLLELEQLINKQK